ncbi:unnamed protein product [Pylaiella littoralis]
MTDPCTDYTGTPDVGSGYIEQVDGAPGECQGCDFSEGGTSSQENMVCMPPHVFAFCIVLSALASGIVVASQRIHRAMREKLRRLLEPSGVHNPHLRRRSASRQLDKNFEGPLVVKAAEAMDRAAAAPLELEDKVPARYVRAFCGNEKHARQRWRATLKWRKENEIDSILNEPQPLFHDIRRYFPSHMSGRSRGGHIVVYEKLGGVDMRALVREIGVTVPMLLRHWIFVSEYQYRVLQPTDSAQQITIEDMKGVRIQSLAGKIQEYIKAVAHLARQHYVERCHKTFVVNAPAWFGLSFRVVSPFLSARTRQKIRILGSDLSALQDEIDPQFLPVEYGGTMTVPVSESSDERNLRRLVDAINANADTTTSTTTTTTTTTTTNKTGKNGDNGRAKSRSPSKKTPKKNRTPAAPAQVIHRTPPRTVSTPGRQICPDSGRSRARANDTAPGSRRKAFSPTPDQRLESHRAPWEGSNHHHSNGPETHAPASRGGKKVSNGGGGGSDAVAMWDAHREGLDSAVGGGAGVTGERAAAVGCPIGSSEGRRDRAGRGDSGGARREHHRGEEDALPIEDRLQAVRRDLGVPFGEQEGLAQGMTMRPDTGGGGWNGGRTVVGTRESAEAVASDEGEEFADARSGGGSAVAGGVLADEKNDGEQSEAGALHNVRAET